MDTANLSTPARAAAPPRGSDGGQALKRATRVQPGPGAQGLFFVGATLLAIVGPPLWSAAYLGRLSVSTLTAAQHAHEMLLGFASAVMAGFLVTKGRRSTVLAAFAAWVVARVAGAGLLPGLAIPGALASVAFVVLLFTLAGVPFLRAVRTGHNLVFAPILGVLVAAEAAYQIAAVIEAAEVGHRAMLVAMDTVTAMMFVMGGRIIAGVAAGELRRQGFAVDHRKHLTPETIGLAALAVAAAADAFGLPMLGAAAMVFTSGAVIYRLWLWRAWCLRERGTLLLILGYGWLAVGLLLPASGLLPRADAVHALSIGALGTLTQTMMIRSVVIRRRLPQVFPTLGLTAVGLLSPAALLRLLAPALGVHALIGAAVAWALAYCLLLAALLRLLTAPAAPTRGRESA